MHEYELSEFHAEMYHTRVPHIPWRPSHQHSSSSNFTLFHHLQDDCRSLPGTGLTYEALRCSTWFEGFRIDSEPSDVRVGCNKVHASNLLGFADSGNSKILAKKVVISHLQARLGD